MTGLVILDRDGVINEDSADFIRTPRDWVALPGSLEAIALLNRSGFDVVVCTNQSGLARGLIDRENLEAIHRHMLAEIRAAGGDVRGIFVCPHGPGDDCECRKPRPGLLQQVAQRLGRPVLGSFVIGDSRRDLEAARAAGARPLLVRTGNGRRTAAALADESIPVFDDLLAAAKAIAGGGTR
ncbi:D-glycero-beta-D-manno-heptose 1,7-bisphosphate 7-phosphatase [Arhodomonas sp. SL1]|uniref:D-glycero-beta-D-manno-heptose 1,7-bisphosphate 7-phosphatase n=1 Tax=Arhodomonas sp. SL1 TaxID=3425691 RepID=UPI003F885241